MILKTLYRVCSDELRRCWLVAAQAYDMLRHLDQMTMGTLKAYLRNDW